MDPVTHTLLGASLGHVAAGRKLGRAAAAAGALAAFLPDADVFVRSAADPLLAIEHHRGFTHSFAFAPLGAALVACLFALRPSLRPRFLPLWLAALLGWTSHELLDAATTYGTQLFWPFSRARVGLDVIAIVDPLFTLALAVGLGVSLKRRTSRPALIGLGLAAAYLAIGTVQHGRALAAQAALAASRGHGVERAELMPTLGNNLVWRGLYLHRGELYADRFRVGLFSAPTVRAGYSLPLVTATDLTPDERDRDRRRSFERFAWFSDDWVARAPDDATVLGDMRYSRSSDAFDPVWGIRFTPPGAPTEVEWVDRSRQRGLELSELWDELRGQDGRHVPVR